ncbi:hypothetical protein [Desulfopila sp. IMCC35006]|uniref:hypothetical protein n=1 Tax=Desulfopila sp. IMCC35006 TaxID=2569542 RepID=UPI00142EFDD8|nr:hypothetical protein [Desulfopila sp. IMCC35006]
MLLIIFCSSLLGKYQVTVADHRTSGYQSDESASLPLVLLALFEGSENYSFFFFNLKFAIPPEVRIGGLATTRDWLFWYCSGAERMGFIFASSYHLNLATVVSRWLQK